MYSSFENTTGWKERRFEDLEVGAVDKHSNTNVRLGSAPHRHSAIMTSMSSRQQQHEVIFCTLLFLFKWSLRSFDGWEVFAWWWLKFWSGYPQHRLFKGRSLLLLIVKSGALLKEFWNKARPPVKHWFMLGAMKNSDTWCLGHTLNCGWRGLGLMSFGPPFISYACFMHYVRWTSHTRVGKRFKLIIGRMSHVCIDTGFKHGIERASHVCTKVSLKLRVKRAGHALAGAGLRFHVYSLNRVPT